jgi:Concanavalin A-like lectin/glucanases superfamily
MAVQFGNVTSQAVNFGGVTQVRGLTQKTYMFRFFWNGLPGSYMFVLDQAAGGERWFIVMDANSKLDYSQDFATTPGIWVTTAALSISTNYHVAITHDVSNPANIPIFYLNGSSVAVTTSQAAAGAVVTGGTPNLEVGASARTGGANSVNGKMNDVRIYNRLLSAAEISIENSIGANPANPNTSGLVFYAPLNMAHGLTIINFVGSTLSSSNTFRDNINCTIGTPNGSPIGA